MMEMCFLYKPVFEGTSSSEVKVSVDKFFETNANTTPYSPGLLQLIRDMLTPQRMEYEAKQFLESSVIQGYLRERGRHQNDSGEDSGEDSGARSGPYSTADLSGTKTQPKHLNWTEYDTFTFASNK